MFAHMPTAPAAVITGNPVLWALIAPFAAPLVSIAVFFHFLPEITRRDIFFAVTVDPAFRNTRDARSIIRRFRVEVRIHSGMGLAIAFVGVAARQPLVPLAGVAWQTGGVLHAFLRARKHTMPYASPPSARREGTLIPRPAGGVAHAFLQAGPFAILVGSALYLAANWQRIPERFPVHWGLDGQPNGWSTRSVAGVYGPLLIGFCLCAMIELFSYGILHWTRQVRASGPGALAETRFRRVQAGILVALEYFFALIFNGLGVLRSHPEQEPRIGLFLLGTFVFIFVLFVILIRTGQGGANLSKAGRDLELVPEGPIGDRTPDQCWRAGMFYVNRNDPAVLVEKRFGIGYTLNFGRPAAWLLLGLILASAAIPLVIALVSVHAR